MSRELQTNDRVRPVRLRTSGATLERLADGTLLVRPEEPLGPYPKVLTHRLTHWAEISPQKISVAQRQKNVDWPKPTYAQVENVVRRIGQALLDRHLST